MLTSVKQQIDGDADSLKGIFSESISGIKTYSDGTYKYLRVPYPMPEGYKLEIAGEGLLEDDLDDDTDTLSIEEAHIPLYTAYACMILYQNLRNQPSGAGMDIYEMEMARWSGKYESLRRRQSMPKEPMKISWRAW